MYSSQIDPFLECDWIDHLDKFFFTDFSQSMKLVTNIYNHRMQEENKLTYTYIFSYFSLNFITLFKYPVHLWLLNTVFAKQNCVTDFSHI